ncbi:hypothetical protein BP6252_06645 [Coleophoma cylindrospora]|uniref:FAD-binding domain-containing protein n=1 Tax=Coleophoma cylindrospora TaxID=1849047 RepID=A0A3D8RN80_9HELO|nr:hypothetical protein BP6252_06645 [Coleophoma cylindrospora]
MADLKHTVTHVETIDDYEATDVLIVGCGPTGAMLSALLGHQKVRNVVLDREPGITTDPRGIALDEDGIRLLQALGLYDDIYTSIGSCKHGNLQFYWGNGKKAGPPTVHENELQHSHIGFICHKQPALEASLRKAMSKAGYSDLRLSSTITSISEDEDWVYARYTDSLGAERKIKSKFLVGADGKTGYTRKQYLEAYGVKLQQASKYTYEETWVALNWKITLPTKETHPDFPLWELGYRPEDVYDAFFPVNFRFLCNPERPAVCGRFGLLEDKLWRFEFLVKKNEDGMEMSEPKMIDKIVFPYITHEGKRYGLQQEVQYPRDCIQTLRSRPFVFSARSCNKWALRRVVLCGDSAHVLPPFGGQGIASGFRDASALAWRLAVACRSGFQNHENLLTGWYTERKQQLERSLALTIENGAFVTETNPVKIFFRDWYLWFLQLHPGWKYWLEMGARRYGMIRYEYEPGMAFLPDMGGGACFPQVYCVPLGVKQGVGQPGFTDDFVFAPRKTGLFQIVVLLDGIAELTWAYNSLAEVDTLSHGEVKTAEATYIIHDLTSGSNSLPENIEDSVIRIATAAEFAQDSRLCGGRPPPKHYDAFGLRKAFKRKNFVILRPDRFVYAACSDKAELEKAVARIETALHS